MSKAKNTRLYNILKFHRSQPTVYADVRECSVCMTAYPCMTVRIARGDVLWDSASKKFVSADV